MHHLIEMLCLPLILQNFAPKLSNPTDLKTYNCKNYKAVNGIIASYLIISIYTLLNYLFRISSYQDAFEFPPFDQLEYQ